MTWEAIEEITLESAAASVTFNTGLSGYKFFRLTGYVVNDGSAKFVRLRINGDSGNNYVQQWIDAASSTITGARGSAADRFSVASIDTLDANSAMSFSALIAKPSASVKGQGLIHAGYDPAASLRLDLNGGEWNNTAATISEVSVFGSSGNLAAGSSFLLEGLAF